MLSGARGCSSGLASLICCAWQLAAGGAAAAAAGPRVAIEPLDGLEGLEDEDRAAIEAGVAVGLAAGGADPVPPAEAATATHRLRGSVLADGTYYELFFELVDAATGTTFSQVADQCELCMASEAAVMARLLVAGLKLPDGAGPASASPAPSQRVVVNDPAPRASAIPEESTRLVPPAPAIERDVPERDVPGERLVERPAGRAPVARVFAWASIGAGLAAAAAGIYLIRIDGTPPCPKLCPSRYATGRIGIATTVGGGLLLATGALLLWSF